MDIINVPIYQAEEDFDSWRKTHNARIGVAENDWFFTGTGPWEFTRVNGALYKREFGDVFFFCEERYTDLPTVLCECGNTAFELRIGGYACHARCAVCGKEQEVYSG